MIYLHRNGGHAVIVCGYYEGNYLINGRYYRYCLVIYDPNNSYTFYQFYITEDFSDFSFQDSNHTSAYEEYVQDTWKDMSYVGIDALQSSFYDSPFAYVWTLADSEATAEMTSADDNSRVQISISAYENFELMNAEGQTLCYDREDYDGTMTVYSVKTVTGSASEGAETAGTLVLTVDASESFTLTGFEGGLTFASEISGRYYSASACADGSEIFSGRGAGICDLLCGVSAGSYIA